MINTDIIIIIISVLVLSYILYFLSYWYRLSRCNQIGTKGFRFYSREGKLIEDLVPQMGSCKLLYSPGISLTLPYFTSKGYSENLRKKKITKDSIPDITKTIKKYNIDMSYYEEREYKSYNDWFIRKLKNNARVLNQDPNILISPADSKLFIAKNISKTDSFFIKGESFNLTSFLGDKDLANKYANQTMCIFRLAPYDYHRFHFPCDCVPTEPKKIKGRLHSVNPIAAFKKVNTLMNKRDVILLNDTPFGDIVFILVGAIEIGSIVHTYPPNTKAKKGDEIGYFQYGGSTCVMLINASVINFNENLLNHSKEEYETQVQMSDVIGKLALK